jgi:hypothetical protein
MSESNGPADDHSGTIIDGILLLDCQQAKVAAADKP